MAITATLLIISMVSFDTLGKALIAPAAYIILMSCVHLTVPVIVKRRLLLNPVAVFIAIIFLGLDLGHAWRTACGAAFGKLQNHLRAHRAS